MATASVAGMSRNSLSKSSSLRRMQSGLRMSADKVRDFSQNIAANVREWFDPDFSDSQAYGWTSPMVGAWLCVMGLERYLDAFLENGVDGVTLLKSKANFLVKCLKIEDANHIRAFYSGLYLLKTVRIDYAKWEWSCNGVVKWLQNRGLRALAPIFKQNSIHGGVLFSFSQKSLVAFLAKLPSFEAEVVSSIVFKSLWLSVLRAKQTGTSKLFPRKFVQDWGEQEVDAWLRSINLPHLSQKFRNHGINGTVLLHLNKKDFIHRVGTTELQSIVLLRQTKILQKFVKTQPETSSENDNDNDTTAAEKFLKGGFPDTTKTGYAFAREAVDSDSTAGGSDTSQDADVEVEARPIPCAPEAPRSKPSVTPRENNNKTATFTGRVARQF